MAGCIGVFLALGGEAVLFVTHNADNCNYCGLMQLWKLRSVSEGNVMYEQRCISKSHDMRSRLICGSTRAAGKDQAVLENITTYHLALCQRTAGVD